MELRIYMSSDKYMITMMVEDMRNVLICRKMGGVREIVNGVAA